MGTDAQTLSPRTWLHNQKFQFQLALNPCEYPLGITHAWVIPAPRVLFKAIIYVYRRRIFLIACITLLFSWAPITEH